MMKSALIFLMFAAPTAHASEYDICRKAAEDTSWDKTTRFLVCGPLLPLAECLQAAKELAGENQWSKESQILICTRR